MQQSTKSTFLSKSQTMQFYSGCNLYKEEVESYTEKMKSWTDYCYAEEGVCTESFLCCRLTHYFNTIDVQRKDRKDTSLSAFLARSSELHKTCSECD